MPVGRRDRRHRRTALMGVEYEPRVREALLGHGLRVTTETPPSLAREFVNDLYRHELRRLRDALLANRIPKRDYAAHVISIRKRYWLLSVPIGEWTAGTED